MIRFRFVLIFSAMVGLAACAPASLTFHTPSTDNSQTGGNTTQGGVVCTPVGTGTPTSQGGLVGQMYYLTPGSTPLNSVDDYIATGHLDPSTFYFSQLYVPTELFTAGFKDENGKYLTTPSGTVLYENFALDLYSVLELGPNDSDGYYQFGVLSDDGAVIDTVDNNGKLIQNLVNNDGQHPTRMGCGTKGVYLDHTTKMNIHVKYYQGPRDEIALIPLWRVVDPKASLDQTYCGDTGNTTFFDPTTTPPTPQTEYKSLTTTHKWAPIKAINYNLPGGASSPCVI